MRHDFVEYALLMVFISILGIAFVATISDDVPRYFDALAQVFASLGG